MCTSTRLPLVMPCRFVVTVHDIIPWWVRNDAELLAYKHRTAEWFDRLALTGALQIVDAVGVAPFGLRVGPDATPTAEEPLVFGRAEEAARVLSRRGVEKPLWATAWGWRVGQGGGREEDGGWGGHDADRVAR